MGLLDMLGSLVNTYTAKEPEKRAEAQKSYTQNKAELYDQIARKNERLLAEADRKIRNGHRLNEEGRRKYDQLKENTIKAKEIAKQAQEDLRNMKSNE